MRHRAKVSTFGRKSGPRKALLRGLVTSLVEHGRIKTTLAKAKELRRHAERAVTLAKGNTLHARRLLLSRYPNEGMVNKLMTEVSPRFATRPGGYTRILRVGLRAGDKAEMALIEWVDYALKSDSGEAVTEDVAASEEANQAAMDTAKKLLAHKRKVARRISSASKSRNRVK